MRHPSYSDPSVSNPYLSAVMGIFLCTIFLLFFRVKEAETAYQAKPVQRYQVYGGDSSVGGSKGGKNKETGLKITVIEEK